MLRHEECRAAARAGTKPALSGLRLSRTMIAGRLVSDAAQGAVGRFDSRPVSIAGANAPAIVVTGQSPPEAVPA